MSEVNNTCKCGRKMKPFIHNCPESSMAVETYGCPHCDDECPLCRCGDDDSL